jgi:hypothetical protein
MHVKFHCEKLSAAKQSRLLDAFGMPVANYETEECYADWCPSLVTATRRLRERMGDQAVKFYDNYQSITFLPFARGRIL